MEQNNERKVLPMPTKEAEPVEKNRIIINIEGDQITEVGVDKPMHILDFLAALFSVQLQSMCNFTEGFDAYAKEQDIKEEDIEKARTEIKEDLYDKYNVAASNVLKAFAPEIEMHPNLTAEAILKAENEILDSLDDEGDENVVQS